MLGERQRGRHGKDQTHPKQMWARRASIVGSKYSLPASTQMGNTFEDQKKIKMSEHDCFHFLAKQYWKSCITVDGKTNHLSNSNYAKNMSVEHAWGSIMSCARKEEMKGQKKGEVKEDCSEWEWSRGAASRRHRPKRAITAAKEKVWVQVPRHSFKNHKSLLDKHILIMPNKEEGEMGGKKSFIKKTKQKWAIVIGLC